MGVSSFETEVDDGGCEADVAGVEALNATVLPVVKPLGRATPRSVVQVWGSTP